ncbi:hypothetical protein AtNW77_Chr1g0077671 [Arabidopsis thaliana]|uniref:T4O12.11 n=3 Tax=Arabidopsis TaxID=3701 RepID=Q9LQS7_ARATH|nr:uncharacterized protein AT1G75870 [Arabidopsis thaliana]KAG7651839.1 hypothetical protein ISN45_At01g066620 [Arabidopsis thaliana x Arabidopsis arenosa]AAF26756.1 T4O12.11 [Arabidopsis thaliana]AAU44438.1 hypothetical protein AT1G75870 [Arabidopsis thaliana]ABE97174.1 hypothetical protein At1g75870 [Arabidopsis thaliana]AEE35767.1 hypothetical protein AT1G75870 [Arabidopsis thaliana]|eukprot:NP_177715.1 hypothetical protein AT1G75870 [Arabidopsis thaliana]
MQETQTKLSLSVTPVNANAPLPQNPAIPLGLIAPYHQQAKDINHMLQNQMTRELYGQLRSLEERAIFCVRVKDKVIEDMKKQCGEMEIRTRKALAEAEFWRKMTNEKTDLCRDLAGRLIEMKKRERATRRLGVREMAEKAESSTGDNGDDVVDTARTRLCKRRRL